MNDLASEDKKWWAKALLVGGVLGLVCLPLGALGTKFGIWGFQGGLMLLAVGVVLATIVFFLGIIALVFTMVRKMQAERGSIVVGLVLSVVILGLMGSQFMAASSLPQIHNITTDTDNPPRFDKVVAIREASESNPHEYDAETLAELQRGAYPSVQPLISATAPSAMMSNAEAALVDMGLEIVDVNSSAGRIEATATTFWFGFKDDVVVRVRAEGAGSIVDVRSVSRVGQSDLGANAARISDLLGRLSGS